MLVKEGDRHLPIDASSFCKYKLLLQTKICMKMSVCFRGISAFHFPYSMWHLRISLMQSVFLSFLSLYTTHFTQKIIFKFIQFENVIYSFSNLFTRLRNATL